MILSTRTAPLLLALLAAACARDASEGRIVMRVQDFSDRQPLALRAAQEGPALAPLAPAAADPRAAYLADNATPDDKLGRADDTWWHEDVDGSGVARFERAEGIHTAVVDLDGDGFIDTFQRDVVPGSTPELTITSTNPRQDGGYLVADNDRVQYSHGDVLRIRVRGWLPVTAPVRVEVWNNWNGGFRYVSTTARIVQGTVDFIEEVVIPEQWPATNDRNGAAYFSYPMDDRFVYPGDNFVLLGRGGPDGEVPVTETVEGTLLVAGGATHVSTTTVDVTLTATGAAYYRLANDPTQIETTPWSALPATDGGTVAWQLPAGPDGTRTVWGQFASPLGVAGEVVQDDVELDQTPIEIHDLVVSPATGRLGTSHSGGFTLSELPAGGLTVQFAGRAPNSSTCSGLDCAFSAVAAAGDPEGATNVLVTAVDAAGWTAQAAVALTLDFTAPDTLFDGTAPSGTYLVDSLAVALRSNEVGVTFECSLDGAAFAACPASQTLSALSDGPHSFAARAIDAAGNVDASPISATFAVETTPPDTVIDSGPAGPVSTPTVQFAFSSPDLDTDGFECSIDGGAYAVCTSPADVAGLTDGPHTFAVRAFDAAGNRDASPASRAFSVDTVAPDTLLFGAPVGYKTNGDATVVFGSADGDVVGYQCSTNGGAWSACTSPRNLTGLADGPYEVAIRAVDAAGNADPTPVVAAWIIDSQAPTASFVVAPANPTNVTLAQFEFGADETSVTFECRLNGGIWSSCGATAAWGGLLDGTHTLDLRATDAAGNVQSVPSTHTWRIDTQAPQILALDVQPPQATTGDTVTISFSTDEAVTTPVVALGGSATTVLVDGGTTFLFGFDVDGSEAEGLASISITVVDDAGNMAQTWGSVTLDFTPPDTVLGPGLPTAQTNLTIGYVELGADEPAAGFECSLNGAAFGPCINPWIFGPLVDGAHSIEVRATDLVGLVDPTPAMWSWVVDTAAPAAPDAGRLEIGVQPSGTSDQLRGTTNAVEGNATVRVYLTGSLTLKLAETVAAADGSFAFFDIGDDVGDADEYVWVTQVDEAGNEGPAVAVLNPRQPPRVTRALVEIVIRDDVFGNGGIGNPGDTLQILWNNGPDGDNQPGIVSVTGRIPLLTGAMEYALADTGDGIWRADVLVATGTVDTDVRGEIVVSGAGGLQTGPVTTINVVNIDNELPPSPAPVTADTVGGMLRIQWTASAAADLVGYATYAGPSTGVLTPRFDVGWNILETVVEVESCVNSDYGVEAIDDAGNRSALVTGGPVYIPLRSPGLEAWGDVGALWVSTQVLDFTTEGIEIHYTPVTSGAGAPPWTGSLYGVTSPVSVGVGRQFIGPVKQGTEFQLAARAYKPACQSSFSPIKTARSLGATGIHGVPLPGSGPCLGGSCGGDTVPGRLFQGGLGFAVARADDLLGADGIEDILTGAPGETAALLVDAANLAASVTQPEYFISDDIVGGGPSLAAGLDLDLDGTSDYVVGSPLASTGGTSLTGMIRVFSGATHAELWRVYGSHFGAQIGYAVALLPDVSGDGRADVLVGGVNCVTIDCRDRYAAPGTAYVLSGLDGSTLRTHASAVTGDMLGVAVAGGVDLVGDATPDYVIGAPGHAGDNYTLPGRVLVIDGATGSEAHTITAFDGSARFGMSVALAAQAAATDPTPRIVVGAPHRLAYGVGQVYIHGADGTPLAALDGALPEAGRWFGTALATNGDLDGSGDPQVIVGEPNVPLSNAYGTGRAFVYRLQDGQLLYEVSGSEMDGALGYALSFLGDQNADGKEELLLGAPGSQVDGLYNAGRLYILSTKPF
jgi:hypothetical protein